MVQLVPSSQLGQAQQSHLTGLQAEEGRYSLVRMDYQLGLVHAELVCRVRVHHGSLAGLAQSPPALLALMTLAANLTTQTRLSLAGQEEMEGILLISRAPRLLVNSPFPASSPLLVDRARAAGFRLLRARAAFPP